VSNRSISPRLLRTALITAPVIALAMATPIAVVTEVTPGMFLLMLGGITVFITVAWMMHIALLRLSSRKWARGWPRILIVFAVMLALSAGVFSMVSPIGLPVSAAQLHLVRIANLLAVNTIIFILSELILTRDKQRRLSEENAELRLANLEAQFHLLKQQVNPHFLFNALGTARSLIRRNPDTAEEYLLRLSEFLRLSLSQSRDLVPLREELQFCRDYVSLQQMRFQEALHFETEILPADENKQVTYFGLLTACENAIKHNSMTRTEPLTIRITSDGGSVTVSNNLQVRVPVAPLTRTGLHNLRERHLLLTGKPLLVEPSATHFKVTLSLLPA
jgi:sensor histidine kinase YesM